MSWGFVKDQTYRRRDVHARFGGQRQSGIFTPKNFALVFAVTGNSGKTHGYDDRWLDDGSFEYFGEGQVGDMTLSGGNSAIAYHSANGESLLLFENAQRGWIRFLDEMVCEEVIERRAPDTRGNMRNALVFKLRALQEVAEVTEGMTIDLTSDLEVLRQRAIAAASDTVATTQGAPRTIYERSATIRDYVLARANGHCEGCGNPAPFLRPDGSAYLEPHHICRVSDGGPDHPRLVIALDPTCHRRVHAGIDGPAYNRDLERKMLAIEPRR